MKRDEIAEAVAKAILAGRYGRSGECFVTIRQLAVECGISLELSCAVVRQLTARRLLLQRGKHYYVTTGRAASDTPLGEQLRSSRRRLLGLQLHNVNTPFFSSLARELSRAAADVGYGLMIADSGDSSEREAENIYRFLELGVSGVFTSPNISMNAELYRSFPLPLVSLGRDMSAIGCDTVLVDNYAAGAQVAKHLHECGCSSYFYIGMGHFMQDDKRRQGFSEQLRRLGAELPSENIAATDIAPDGQPRLDPAIGLLNSCLHRLMPGERLGIFCYHDLLAAQTVRLLRRLSVGSARQLRIPEDVAVVGFDDLPIASQITPTLSTVSYHYESLAASSLELLLDAIAEPEHEARRRLVASSLTVRESSRCNGR